MHRKWGWPNWHPPSLCWTEACSPKQALTASILCCCTRTCCRIVPLRPPVVVTPCPLLLCHSWSFKMSEYGVTLKDLKQVVENYRQSPDVNFPNTMNEIGGSEGLMQKLKTTADGGIRVDSMESRQEAFGPNSMPVKPPPTYLELCWEALQDATLVMLIIAAVVSLVLGFAFEEDKSTAWCVPSARAVATPRFVLLTRALRIPCCVFPAAARLVSTNATNSGWRVWPFWSLLLSW